jgi:hypothetical protein
MRHRSLRYGESISWLAAKARFSTSEGVPVSIRGDESGDLPRQYAISAGTTFLEGDEGPRDTDQNHT